MSGLYLPYQKIFSLTNENMHYDVDENLCSNPQDRVEKKHSAVRNTPGDILLYAYCSFFLIFFFLIFFYLI